MPDKSSARMNILTLVLGIPSIHHDVSSAGECVSALPKGRDNMPVCEVLKLGYDMYGIIHALLVSICLHHLHINHTCRAMNRRRRCWRVESSSQATCFDDEACLWCDESLMVSRLLLLYHYCHRFLCLDSARMLPMHQSSPTM